MNKLVDLKRGPAEVKKESAIRYKPSPYGYGTNISLDHDALKKLGVTDLPDVGDEFTITAKGKVTSASANSSEESGKRTSLSIQLTHMNLVPGSAAAEKKEAPATEKAEPAASKPATKSAPLFGSGAHGINFR